MRKAKVAAIIIGGVSTCLFGGLFGVYATAPVVSSVAPKNDVEKFYDVKNEELSNVAAVTSIRTTAVTTTSKKSTTTTTKAVYAETTSAAAVSNDDTITFTASVNGVSANAGYNAQPATEAPTEAQTENYTEYTYYEPITEAPTEYVYTEPETEAPTEAPTEYIYVEPATEAPTEPEVIDIPVDNTASSLPISESDYIILCNAVAHEAGCYWIDEYDKAKVVEVIMNRVYSPYYPNTITGVLTQPYQFSGSSSYVYLGTYSGYVTESVKNAVNLYFNEPESFSHGYFSFYGDGYRNYFS